MAFDLKKQNHGHLECVDGQTHPKNQESQSRQATGQQPGAEIETACGPHLRFSSILTEGR